jgi:hypothetical protein
VAALEISGPCLRELHEKAAGGGEGFGFKEDGLFLVGDGPVPPFELIVAGLGQVAGSVCQIEAQVIDLAPPVGLRRPDQNSRKDHKSQNLDD